MPPLDNTAPVRPATSACLECRQAHLKCDGARPVCGRCASHGSQCIYTISRRGRRRGMQRVNKPFMTTSDAASLYHSSLSLVTSTGRRPDTNHIAAAVASADPVQPAPLPDLPPLPLVTTGPIEQHSKPHTKWVDDFQLVNLYFLNFHPNHPILVPKNIYWKRDYPWFLKALVEFIGSHFSDTPPTCGLREDAANEIERGGDAPVIVQARILHAILLLAHNEIRSCQELLAHAAACAVDLGMHRRQFARSHSSGQPKEEEESLRRTWYELYVLEGVVAAFQRNASFRTSTVNADVLLPCEDNVYNNGMTTSISSSQYDFEISAFTDEDSVFSSFCYRIEAVRLLERVLAITGSHGVERERVQAIDNALAAFLHHLPISKREPEIINVSGEIDGLMFQTHMIIQYATILLHFPRGNLHLAPSMADIPGGCTAKFVCPCSRQHVHSVKAVDASRAICMLAAFRIPTQKLPPLFAYPLVLCAVVQLSLFTSPACRDNHLEQHRDSVKLILGVLKSMGQYWLSSGLLSRALKKRALRTFTHSCRSSSAFASGDNPTNDSTTDPPQANEDEFDLNHMIHADLSAFMDFEGLIDLDNGLLCA